MMNTEELLFTKIAMLESKVDALQSTLVSVHALLSEAITAIDRTSSASKTLNSPDGKV